MASNQAKSTTVIPSRSQNASSSASSSSTAPRDGELPPRQRKHVTTACTACRRSKTKCDGNIPCTNCTKSGTQHLCAAPEGLDGRRGRKRMLNEYQTKVDALESILDFLRSSDAATIQGLIDLTRSEAPIDVIVQHAKEIIDHEEIRDPPPARRQVMSIAALVDKAPIQVPAKPWTNICDDDETVSHLISVYFTWHHFSHPVVDQDIFLWHMKSADLASEFCSPFLVSSILAAACFYTDHVAAFAVAGDLSSRGVHFRDEAIRLWNLEEGKASIANLQAIPILTASVCFSGKDRLNYLFVSQINTLSLEVVKMVKRREKQGDASAVTVEFQRSYSCAIWGSFICQTDIGIGWRHPFDIRLPNTPLPYNEDELLVSRRWTAYPKVNMEASAHFNGLINERISHFTIAKDLLSLILTGDPEDSPLPGHLILDKEVRLASLHDIEERLQEWYDQLPEYAAVNTESRPSASLLDLHMSYHVHQLTIQNVIVHQDDIPTDLRKEAEKKLLASCRQIIRLYDWMKQTIGFTHFGFQFVHCGVSAAYALMDFLITNPEIKGWFYTISVALCSASRRQVLTRGIVKMIWITLQQRHLEPYVSEATIDLLKLSVVDNWKPEEDLLFASCAYPNYYAMYENGREFADMGDLLAEYSSMGLEN